MGKGNPNLKSEDQIRVIQNIEKYFDLTEKNVFLEITLFLLSEAKYKAKRGKRLKILTSKQNLQRLPIALA